MLDAQGGGGPLSLSLGMGVASEDSPFPLLLQEQLEAALELTRQQLGQAPGEAPAPRRAWGRQRLLQDRLVSVRATLCHLSQVSIWKGTCPLKGTPGLSTGYSRRGPDPKSS